MWYMFLHWGAFYFEWHLNISVLQLTAMHKKGPGLIFGCKGSLFILLGCLNTMHANLQPTVMHVNALQSSRGSLTPLSVYHVRCIVAMWCHSFECHLSTLCSWTCATEQWATMLCTAKKCCMGLVFYFWTAHWTTTHVLVHWCTLLCPGMK